MKAASQIRVFLRGNSWTRGRDQPELFFAENSENTLIAFGGLYPLPSSSSGLFLIIELPFPTLQCYCLSVPCED
ncbi:MAG: hypothetical protein RAO92_02860 [Candidatus Euphemobacter frigidus]|nr:hypothetical protein [Candidatus Euphemobacter frigidus]MDP8275320.1 hypothetical protein [Candidatus Euphemobacter frigidus]